MFWCFILLGSILFCFDFSLELFLLCSSLLTYLLLPCNFYHYYWYYWWYRFIFILFSVVGDLSCTNALHTYAYGQSSTRSPTIPINNLPVSFCSTVMLELILLYQWKVGTLSYIANNLIHNATNNPGKLFSPVHNVYFRDINLFF